MPARIEYQTVAPDSTKGLTELARFARSGTISRPLLELVMLRASQMNGCAYCLDVHFRRARRAGVSEAQLDTLGGWDHSPAFSDRERAALAWTESMTDIGADHAPNAVWEQLRTQFTEREIVELSIAIVEINSWNRLMIGFRTPPTFGVAEKSSPASSPAASGGTG